MVFLNQAQKNSHWEPVDSLYATMASNVPTVVPVGPSYATPTSSLDEKKDNKKDKKFNLPVAALRPIEKQKRILLPCEAESCCNRHESLGWRHF